MASTRRTISLPAALAEHLDREADERGVSFSALIAELAATAPSALPYAGLVDDDADLSLRVAEVLGRLDR